MRAVKGSLGHSSKERFRKSERPRSTAAVRPARVPFQRRELSQLAEIISDLKKRRLTALYYFY
jgi:hypothetical protein